METALATEAIWQDVECGGYADDLPLFERLADDANGPVLDLGCGTGRVSLHLARRGHEITAIDNHPLVLEVLGKRAASEGLSIQTVLADARSFDLSPATYDLVLAPMQLAQLLGGPVGRREMFERVAAHLTPGGRAAISIVEEPLEGVAAPSMLPDLREHDGTVYSSMPTRVSVRDGHFILERLRQVVSPGGELTEQTQTTRLDLLDAEDLEADGRSAGLLLLGRERLPDGETHVGSTIVLLEAPGG